MDKGLTAHPFWNTLMPSQWFGMWLDTMQAQGINHLRVDVDYLGRQTDEQIIDLISLANSREIKIRFTLARIGPKPWPAPDPNTYCSYAAHIASLEGVQGHNISIWNKPNNTEYWIDPNPTLYANLVDLAYGAIKSVNSNVYVSGGEILCNDPSYRQAFLRASPRMDEYTFQPYTNNYTTTDRHDRWYSFQDTLGDTLLDLDTIGYTGLPIVITEFGWPHPNSPITVANYRSAIALLKRQLRVTGAIAFELGESWMASATSWSLIKSDLTPTMGLTMFANAE